MLKGSVVRFEVRIRERIADQVEKGGEGKAYDGNIPMKSFDMICDLHYGGRRSN